MRNLSTFESQDAVWKARYVEVDERGTHINWVPGVGAEVLVVLKLLLIY